MKRRLQFFLTLCAVLLVGVSCTETGSGIGIIYDQENVITKYGEFGVISSSQAVGSVRNSGSNCYLGCIIDPETQDTIRATFATQFHTFENYRFPERKYMFQQDSTTQDVDHSADPVECDSVEVRLFYTTVFGDALNPMKLEVYELDKEKVIREDTAYYSDTDLMEQFVQAGAKPIATKTFVALDYNLEDSVKISETYTPSVRIMLPKSYGNALLNAYYDDPSSFKDTYTFIRKVCPGLYFRLMSGSGTMLTVDVSTLNLYFQYYDTKKKDMTSGFCRFAATPEVMQCSQIDRTTSLDILEQADTVSTFLQTPAGICTVLELPVEEVMKGHANDTISRARIVFPRYNTTAVDGQVMAVPSQLLMVRKSQLKEFFAERKVADNKTSFTTNFDKDFNYYCFNNIGALITECWKDKQAGTDDPDWNKVALVPVKVVTATNSYGENSQVSVSHDMQLSSARLVKGKSWKPIPLQVVYSTFE